MFQGLRTLIYRVQDLQKAKNWYSTLLGQKPYFDQPFYVGFNVGGYELGLQPSMHLPKIGDNAETYWGVQNIEDALEHCLEAGGTIVSEIQDVGENIKVATIRDPFGNILGLIENPNFSAKH
jgi:predicted enzyme related to lactoylglutathione lyase